MHAHARVSWFSEHVKVILMHACIIIIHACMDESLDLLIPAEFREDEVKIQER